MTLAKIRWYLSVFTILESFIARYVRVNPIGNSIMQGTQGARLAGRTKVSANFLQNIFRMIKIIKNTIEIKIGYPKPPFLTIAPIGAPINRKIKQTHNSKLAV